MTAIPHQVEDFLRLSAPFDQLDQGYLQQFAARIKVLYLTAQNLQDMLGDVGPGLFLIHSGQFSVTDSEAPQRHVSEGDCFGFPGLLDDQPQPLDVVVDRPGLVYFIAAAEFSQCCQQYPAIKDFFQAEQSDLMHHQAVTGADSAWLYRPLSEVIEGQAITAEQDTPIHQAAAVMAEHKVSSLLITAAGQLVGIVTDRDLRNRVVAIEADVKQPVSSIMTAEPQRIKQQSSLLQAVTLMSEANIHHLPVIDNQSQQPVGMLTATDIVRQQRGNVLFIIGALSKAQNLYELTRCAWQLPQYVAGQARRPGDFDIAGKVLSQACDIMTRKLISFFEQQQGKAPLGYCWIVYGSQAREDQNLGSDQDNALLLASPPDEGQAAYFAAMTDYVCQGLAKCGIKLCAGNIMASNPELRLPLDEAIREARKWVAQPTSQAIMHFNIFLDARAVAGDTSLFAQMQQARAPLFQQPQFLAALARHTNQVSVPLSVFQKFVYAKGQQRPDCIDLKTSAIAIINDLVRLYALAGGLSEPGTLQRLANLPATSGLSPKDAANLGDIWRFLNRLRWRHQLANHSTDNLVSVSDLSPIQKHQLKASFKAIDQAQQAAVLKFSGGMG